MSDTTTASELLINIKTLLDSQGLDAAKRELDKVIAATRDSGRAQDGAAASTDKAAQEMQKATRAAFALRMAASGSSEGLRGITAAAMALGNNLGTLVGKMSIYGAAFAGGFTIGKNAAEKFRDMLDTLREKAILAALPVRKTKEELDKLNETNLDSIKKRFDELTQSIADASTGIDSMQGRLNRERKSEYERKKAEIATGPMDDLSRRRALVELDYEYETASAQDDISNSIRKGERLTPKQEAVKKEREQAQNDYSQKKTRQMGLQAKWGDNLKSGEASKEEKEEFAKASDELKLAENALRIAEGRTRDFAVQLDEARAEIETTKKVAGNRLATAGLKRDQGLAEINAGRDAETETWLSNMANGYDTPADVSKRAKSDIVGSLSLQGVVARDNAGLQVSPGAQKAFDAQRSRDAEAAVTQAQADMQAGQSSDVVMANLVEVLSRLHVRLVGQVDTRKKLQEVLNRLDGVEGEQRDQKSRETTSPGLN